MKINTKQGVKNFKGEDFKNEDDSVFTFGEAISSALLSAKEGGKMKMFVLAEKFYKQKEVELDEADLSIVKQAVEKTEALGTIVIGQVLIALENLKEEKKK